MEAALTRQKVALVTGALGGIGAATCVSLRSAGYRVVGLDKRPGADLVSDLGTSDEAHAVVEATIEESGRLDVVIAAHGISGRSLGDGPVVDCREEAWDAVLATNLRSVFLLCKHVIPELIGGGGGAIVAIGSVLGIVAGDADFATHAYAASKAGLVGLVRGIAATYARQGVRANIVAPGLIATAMTARAQNNDAIRARLTQLQPITGDFGRPEQIAAAVLYLAEAEFVTGVVLPVDGGWTVH
jgi:NAD(P)-dependent dehydrogenase (short-subunit alcohol dehydrogenase family)